MDEANEADAPPTIDDLFEQLGSRPRMELMQLLWTDFDFQAYVTGTQQPRAYSELRDRSGVDDPGNFNYHLRALAGSLVTQRDGGYVLSPLGYNVMRMIERYGTFEYRELPSQPLASDCPFCEGELVGRYERELVHVRCTACDGLGDDGTINYVQIPASTGSELAFDRLLAVGAMEIESRIRYSARGTCPDCYGDLERTLRICEEHAPSASGSCPHCTQRFACTIEVDCPSCSWGGAGPLGELAIIDPVVRETFDRHELGPHTAGPWAYRLNAFAAIEETHESGDASSYAFAFDVDDDRVDVTFDGGDVADRQTHG